MKTSLRGLLPAFRRAEGAPQGDLLDQTRGGMGGIPLHLTYSCSKQGLDARFPKDPKKLTL